MPLSLLWIFLPNISLVTKGPQQSLHLQTQLLPAAANERVEAREISITKTAASLVLREPEALITAAPEHGENENLTASGRDPPKSCCQCTCTLVQIIPRSATETCCCQADHECGTGTRFLSYKMPLLSMASCVFLERRSRGTDERFPAGVRFFANSVMHMSQP